MLQFYNQNDRMTVFCVTCPCNCVICSIEFSWCVCLPCSFITTEHGQCEVKCNTVDGYRAGGNGKHGLMPDGTPCMPTELSSFIERNKLPRKSGMFGRCVQGYCLVSLH